MDNAAERIISYISEHGPKTIEQLVAALNMSQETILRHTREPIREGLLIARDIERAKVYHPIKQFSIPGAKPKYDPMDPFGLVAKRQAERRAAQNNSRGL